MNREQAMRELEARITRTDILRHCLYTEAVMTAVAQHLTENTEFWGLAGLLHRIDYERTLETPELRGRMGADILQDLGMEPEIVYAVRAFCEDSGLEKRRRIDKALTWASPVAEILSDPRLWDPEGRPDVSELIHRLKTEPTGEESQAHFRASEALGIKHEELIQIAVTAVTGCRAHLSEQMKGVS